MFNIRDYTNIFHFIAQNYGTRNVKSKSFSKKLPLQIRRRDLLNIVLVFYLKNYSPLYPILIIIEGVCIKKKSQRCVKCL